MLEKAKNNQSPYRKARVYGCGLLLLMLVVLGGLVVVLGKAFFAGQALLGADWTNCQPESRYQFTFAGYIYTMAQDYNGPRLYGIAGTKVEIFSEELKRILESGDEVSFCESDYLQTIQVTTDYAGHYVVPNVKFVPWDDLTIAVHVEGYQPYQAAFYNASSPNPQILGHSVFLEPNPGCQPSVAYKGFPPDEKLTITLNCSTPSSP